MLARKPWRFSRERICPAEWRSLDAVARRKIDPDDFRNLDDLRRFPQPSPAEAEGPQEWQIVGYR